MKRSTLAVSVIAMLITAPACSTQASQSPAPSSSTQSPAPLAATTVSQFDPQWMTLQTPQSWTESDRRITREFRQFGLRPVDESELPRQCNGCGVRPPTAFLTAYAPGEFDPAQVRGGEAVTVNADDDGFFRASQGSEDAVLAWRYAEDAWATVRGRTTITSEPARMVELARALRPAELTAIRLPVSIPQVPESMPLAEISVDDGEYGTTLIFTACGRTDVSGMSDCYGKADSMRVQVWPADGYSGHIQEEDSVPIRIGGAEGLYDANARRAAVQVQPGVLAVFQLDGPWSRPGQPSIAPKADFTTILEAVRWAPDPGDEQTWTPVTEWARTA